METQNLRQRNKRLSRERQDSLTPRLKLNLNTDKHDHTKTLKKPSSFHLTLRLTQGVHLKPSAGAVWVRW